MPADDIKQQNTDTNLDDQVRHGQLPFGDQDEKEEDEDLSKPVSEPGPKIENKEEMGIEMTSGIGGEENDKQDWESTDATSNPFVPETKQEKRDEEVKPTAEEKIEMNEEKKDESLGAKGVSVGVSPAVAAGGSDVKLDLEVKPRRKGPRLGVIGAVIGLVLLAVGAGVIALNFEEISGDIRQRAYIPSDTGGAVIYCSTRKCPLGCTRPDAGGGVCNTPPPTQPPSTQITAVPNFCDTSRCTNGCSSINNQGGVCNPYCSPGAIQTCTNIKQVCYPTSSGGICGTVATAAPTSTCNFPQTETCKANAQGRTYTGCVIVGGNPVCNYSGVLTPTSTLSPTQMSTSTGCIANTCVDGRICTLADSLAGRKSGTGGLCSGTETTTITVDYCTTAKIIECGGIGQVCLPNKSGGSCGGGAGGGEIAPVCESKLVGLGICCGNGVRQAQYQNANCTITTRCNIDDEICVPATCSFAQVDTCKAQAGNRTFTSCVLFEGKPVCSYEGSSQVTSGGLTPTQSATGVKLCGDGKPIVWCATFQCPSGDTSGDGQCTRADRGAVENVGSGSGCADPGACGQRDFYSSGPQGVNWGAYCGHDAGAGLGSDSCKTSGSSVTVPAPTPVPMCLAVRTWIYAPGQGCIPETPGSAKLCVPADWKETSASQLGNLLKVGDIVRFTVEGKDGTFVKARFSVNNGNYVESTDRSGSAFYYDYTITQGGTIKVTAQVFTQ